MVGRFKGLVQIVDSWHNPDMVGRSAGYLQGVANYLELPHLQIYFDHFGIGTKTTKNYQGSFSTGWLECCRRVVTTFAKVFVLPTLTKDEQFDYLKAVKHMCTGALTSVQRVRAASIVANEVWEEDADVPEGGRFRTNGGETVNGFL
jgi:hypothetical protein